MVREKTVKLHKVPGEGNVADLGTKALDPKRHQMLLQMLPLAVSQSSAFLAVARASLGAKATEVDK